MSSYSINHSYTSGLAKIDLFRKLGALSCKGHNFKFTLDLIKLMIKS